MVFPDLEPLRRLAEANDLEGIERMRSGRSQQARYRPPYPRSALMLSGHRLEHLNKLDGLEADMVILNLEDGVAPSKKPLALRLIGLFLAEAASMQSLSVVRINPLDEGGEAEIAYLNAIRPDAIRIPKIRTEADVARALELVDDAIRIHLSIETKEAFAALARLRIDARVDACYLGILDLLASMRLPQRLVKPDNPTIHTILAHFLLECATAEMLPVSFVYQDYRNLEEFERWCNLEKQMGYHAKGCISPAQVTIANRIFAPDEEALARARAIVELFESDPDESSFVHETFGFVDEPIYRDACNLLKTEGEKVGK